MKLKLLAVAASVLLAGQAMAASTVLQGNYIKTAVNDAGTLGFGGTITPGLQHDATGTGSFGVDDYLTPGTPWDLFGVKTNQGGQQTNNNTSPFASSPIAQVSATDLSGGVFDNQVIWNGTVAGLYNITNDYRFNDNSQQIDVYTTITALTDLTGVKFVRSIDPDPDVNTFGSYYTINGRGFGSLSGNDWVHSEGTSTGLTLGLYSNSAYTHNTGVSSGWTSSPEFFLAGNDDGNGDYTIGIAFDLDTIAVGGSKTFNYKYVVGGKLDDATNNTGGTTVPEPSSLALFGLSLLGLSLRKSKK